MFVVAVTRSERSISLPGLDCQHFQHRGWSITVGANPSTARLTEQNGGFSLIESPLVALSPKAALPVAGVEFAPEHNELRITKPLYSGRPLYYHQNAEGEFFCSTHIACFRHLGIRLQTDEAALPEYLIYRYVVPPSTLYKSVSLLPLGASLRVTLTPEGCVTGNLEHWSAPEPDSDAAPEDSAAEMVLRLAARLKKLSPAQAELAVLLSGGLDSTTLFRSSQTLFKISDSYSTGFPFEDPAENLERQYAESAATALGAKHHYHHSTPDDYLPGFLSAIAAAEEPVHHLQSILLHLLFKDGLPSDKRVVISGEGADGIFGVDLQRRIWRREHKPPYLTLLSNRPFAAAVNWFTRATGRGSGLFEPVLAPPMGYDYENPEHELWSVGSYGSTPWVLERFSCPKEALFRSRLDLVNRIRNRSVYDVISLLSLMGEGAMTEIIWSKLGEASGRFVDYPFLDPDLLSLAYRTPWETKLREPKALMRGALRSLKVPEFIINRPKSSFGLNRRGWALQGGLFEPVLPLAAKVFPERELRSLQSDDWPKASTFWALLNYALWKRLCVDGESLQSLRDELAEQMNAPRFRAA